MTVKRRYAEGTTVSPEKSQQEIGMLLRRYGAQGVAIGWEDDRAAVAFRAHDRQVRFVLTFPDPGDRRFRLDGRGYVRSESARRNAYDAEHKRLWRALLLAIKAKLEVVESGIATFEEEFLAHIVLPDGSTVGEHTQPAVAAAYETGRVPALVPRYDERRAIAAAP